MRRPTKKDKERWEKPASPGQQKNFYVQKNRNWLRRKLRRMGIREWDDKTRARRFEWPPREEA